jgi:hypothetical protein
MAPFLLRDLSDSLREIGILCGSLREIRILCGLCERSVTGPLPAIAASLMACVSFWLGPRHGASGPAFNCRQM